MGGTVGVTIKHNDQLKKMARKTGSYNWLLFSDENNFGNVDKAIKDYYKVFDEMRDDYLSGEPYDMAMSPAYGWCEKMIPVDYGLVFVDYDKKEIHSLQGYDTPGNYHLTEFSPYNKSADKKEKEKLVLNNKLKIVLGKNEISLQEAFNTQDNEEILKALKKLAENPYDFKSSQKILGNKYPEEDYFLIQLKLDGWNIIKYDEDIDGLLSFFNNVKENLNQEEIKEWKDYAKNYFLDDYWDENVEKMEEDGKSENEINQYIEVKQKEILNKFDNSVPKKNKKNS